MEELTLHLKNMHILSYEVGNMNKIKNGNADKRPICALMLTDSKCKHKVKALFKHDKAIDVDKYIVNRRNIGEITNETVEVVGKIREFRQDCVVLDNIADVWFDISVGI